MKGAAKGMLPLLAAIVGLYFFQVLGGVDWFSPYTQDALLIIGINVVLGLSLNIVNGFTGQFSIGHAGFMALGAYAAGGLTYYGAIKIWGTFPPELPAGWGDLWFVFALVAGGLVAALAGWLVGLPSLRLRGDYLAIVTLGFAEIIRILITQTEPVLDKAQTAKHSTVALIGYLGGKSIFDRIPRLSSFFWVYSVVVIVFVVCYRLKTSTHGRAMLAVRENEIAAEAMGVNTTRYKVRAFVLSSFFAGVAGGLYACKLGNLDANRFDFQRSFEAVVIVVLGGMGSISGVCLAAVIVTYAPYFLRDMGLDQYRMVIYALTLVVLMIVRPQGLFGTHEVWELVRPGPRRRFLRAARELPGRWKDRVLAYARKVAGPAA